jgi:AAA domain
MDASEFGAWFDEADRKAREQVPPEPEQARKSRGYTRQQTRDLPPPRWLVEGLIQANTDAAIYAPKAFLKSFIGLDIGLSIATAMRAFGLLPVTEPGCVVYWAGEGFDDVVKKRMSAWEIAHNLEPYTVENVYTINGAPYVNQASIREQDMSDITDWLSGRRTSLIVVDTLARSLNGEDEDRAATASKYQNMLKDIRERLGGSTLTIAHTGKDTSRGGRGSSAFEMGFDTVLRVVSHHHELDSDQHVICIEVAYQKIGPERGKFFLKTRTIITDDGASLVLEPCSEADAAAIETEASKAKITVETVQDSLAALSGGGGNIGIGKLAQHIADRMGKKKDSVQRTLNRKKKNEFAAFYMADTDRWALPLDDGTSAKSNGIDKLDKWPGQRLDTPNDQGWTTPGHA